MTDQTFSLSTRIARPAAEVFAWHERPGALARLCPPWERVEQVAATGGVRDGARVTVRNKVGPFWSEWEVEHRDYIAGEQFRDVLLSGPFPRWQHLHRVTAEGAAACTLTDSIQYRLPGGFLGQAIGGGWVRRKLNQLFEWRHATTRADLELTSQYGAVTSRRVLIAGASGLIGKALTAFLESQGHSVERLVRRSARRPGEVSWNPVAGEIDDAVVERADAIINLSGENVGAGRWTAARRQAIRQSRVDATRTLVRALQRARRKPEVLVNASAVGFDGERGVDILNEREPIGGGFLAEVCGAWETEATAASRAGVRVAIMRLGVVLAPGDGALGKLLPLFRVGLGGRVGNGRQWMSWIGIDDAVGAIYHALVEPTCHGPFNTVAPDSATNAEFTATLGRVVHRPTIFPVPAAILRLVFGEMADGTLLASTRAAPVRLLESGYRFRHPRLEAALRHVTGSG